MWTRKVPKARLLWSPTRTVTTTGELVGDAQLGDPRAVWIRVCTVKPPRDSYILEVQSPSAEAEKMRESESVGHSVMSNSLQVHGL